MDLTLILTVLGIAATFLAPAVGYLLKVRKDYRNFYNLLWKDSAKLKPKDMLGERPYNDFYLEREYDLQLKRLLERRRSILITGAPLSGKTRAVYRGLLGMAKHADILSTRAVFMSRFSLPPNIRFWREKIIFIDDLQYYIEKQENFNLIFKAAKEGHIPIVATCHSGREITKVRNKMTEQNIDLDNIFGEDIIVFDKLNADTGKEIAGKLGMEWDKVKFNGTIGSIFMKLSEMERRYDSCDNIEKTILRVLRNLYTGGVSDESGIFDLDWIKKAAKSYELEGRDFEWTGWMKQLEDKEFVKITRRNRIWAEDAYLEFIVKPLVEMPVSEILDDLADTFSDTPDALLMIGERAYDSGIIDIQIAEYMKTVIKAFTFVLERPNETDAVKNKAQQYLGKAYWSLAKVENTLENCRIAIGYFEDILKNIDTARQPYEYANIKVRIGNTYTAFAETENKKDNCIIAVNSYNEALKYFTFDYNPLEYARVQNNLGGAYLILSQVENRSENFKNAIECFRKALEVRTVSDHPRDYALTKNNLANTYAQLSELENPKQNLKLAVSCYEDALAIYTKKKFSLQFGITMNNLGNAYAFLGKYEDRKQNLEKAVGAYERSLEVRQFETVPLQYANTMANLGDVYFELAGLTGNAMQLDRAIDSFNEALKVRTIEKSPLQYAETQYLLGQAYTKLAAFDSDKSDNYNKAIAAFDESMRIFTPDGNPEMYALVQEGIQQAKKVFFV